MNMETNTNPTPKATRREFLKQSATLTAAATLGGLEISRSAYAAGSDTLRVGMIGCGGRNTGAASQALTADKGAKLVAMGDVLMDRVEARHEDLKRAKPNQVDVPESRRFAGFDAYKKVIECSDVVVIANAAKFHPLHALSALQAGKHVFVEKPHGIDPYGMKMLKKAVDLAREKNLSLVSGLQSRRHPGYVETIRRIHEGAIGDVVTIEENFLRPPYVVVSREPGLNEIQWQCSTQYHFTWLSGDDVPQSLVHNLDRASWVLKNQAPIKCHGMGGRSSMTAPIYGNVFDHHAVVYECANGVRIYAFCRTTNGCYNGTSSLIAGTKGKADILNCRITGEMNWQWQGQGDPYQIEHDHLFASVRAGKAINDGDFMIRSTMIGIMGQLSCYTGQEVTWEQVNQSDFAYPPKPEDCHDDMEPPTKPGPDGTYPTYIPGKTKLL